MKMMRTSVNQFKTMVDFMERNGDLSRPIEGSHGMAYNHSKWTKLTCLLNRDRSGTPKPVIKWRKVWSDLKNNTKRKMSRIHKASCSGEESTLVLSEIEKRVLKVIKGPAAVSSAIVDVNRVEVNNPEPNEELTQLKPPTPIQNSKPEDRHLRTSVSQFGILVDFMERYGDLNRLGKNPQVRVANLAKWTKLTTILNLDTKGAFKPCERWRKVWSDFKNNTKRKAARINRGEDGLNKRALSDLEVRVLNLIRNKSSHINRSSFNEHDTQVDDLQSPESSQPPQSPAAPMSLKSSTGSSPPESPVASPQPGSPTTSTHFILDEDSMEIRDMPETSRQIEDAVSPAPEPGPSGTSCQNSTSSKGGEERWQNFVADFATEYLKLRDRELQQQAQWQTLFGKFLDIMENITEKF